MALGAAKVSKGGICSAERRGDEGYAKEELVAELGSADLGITPEVREDHAAYIAQKGDKRFIFTAAAHAQHALECLHGLQPQVGRRLRRPLPRDLRR